MFTRLLRAASAPRNIATAGVLVLAVSGIAYAAIGSGQITNNSLTGLDIKNNSVGTADVQNNSLTGADVKNRSLNGIEIATNSITGVQVNESTLEKVPSASKADTATSATSAATATNATNATNATTAATATAATLADKAKGFTRVALTFVSASDAANLAAGRTSAPLVTVFEAGSLKIQMQCIHDTTSDVVYGLAYGTTTKEGALLTSSSSSLNGGAAVNNLNYLYTDSALVDRQVAGSQSNNDQLDFAGAFFPFSTVGIDGSWIFGDLGVITRNGTFGPVTGASSTFYGTEHSCGYVGSASHSGAA